MGAQALTGVRILDLSHSWAAPHATRLLADFGADVIRVEYARRMCALRGARLDENMYNRHAMWHQVNRAKRSVTLDLHEARDRDIVRELVAVSDVVFENARGGVLDALGLAYTQLVEIKPDLIHVSMPAYGSTGPYASYAGYGGSVEVLSGIQNLTAYAKGERPRRIKELDVANGVMGACAVMTALVHKQRTGRGQWIDLSHMEAATHALAGEHLLQHVMNGSVDLPAGNRHPRYAPQGCYPCQGQDHYVTITIRSDAEWERFCDAAVRPDWRAPRFATVAGRRRLHDEIDQMITGWTRARTAEEIVERLQASGIPAGHVLHLVDLARDPHLRARGYFVEATDGSPGEFMGAPVKLSATPSEIRAQGPLLGQHNEEVVVGLLKRPAKDVPVVGVSKLGTAYDPE